MFAEQQTAPNYGYLFEVSRDRKRIVRCAHISAIGGDSDNPDGDAERLEKDARQAVEEFLDLERDPRRRRGSETAEAGKKRFLVPESQIEPTGIHSYRARGRCPLRLCRL